MDLPFQKIIHERKLLLVGQLCILLCNAVQEKIAEYRIYIESVTKCNQLKDWFAGAGKVISELHANHAQSIEKYLVPSFGYFFAKITSSVIRQTHDKIGIQLELHAKQVPSLANRGYKWALLVVGSSDRILQR